MLAHAVYAVSQNNDIMLSLGETFGFYSVPLLQQLRRKALQVDS